MSVIVWDGLTLAADRRVVEGSSIATTRKITTCAKGLLGYSGPIDLGEELQHWFIYSGKPHNFPDSVRKTDHWPVLLVITSKRQIQVYEQTPFPLVIYDSFYAIGSGAPYALAALYLGQDATSAVEVASHFDCRCGNGIDTLTL